MKKYGISKLPVLGGDRPYELVSYDGKVLDFGISGENATIALDGPAGFTAEEIRLGQLPLGSNVKALEAIIGRLSTERNNLLTYEDLRAPYEDLINDYGPAAEQLTGIYLRRSVLYDWFALVASRFPDNIMYLTDGSIGDQGYFEFPEQNRDFFNTVRLHLVNKATGEEERSFYCVRFKSGMVVYGQPTGDSYFVLAEADIASKWYYITEFDVVINNSSTAARNARKDVTMTALSTALSSVWSGQLHYLAPYNSANPQFLPYGTADYEADPAGYTLELTAGIIDWAGLQASGSNSFLLSCIIPSTDLKAYYVHNNTTLDPYYNLNFGPTVLLEHNDGSDELKFSLRHFPIAPIYRNKNLSDPRIMSIPMKLTVRYVRPKIVDFFTDLGEAFYRITETDLGTVGYSYVPGNRKMIWNANRYALWGVIRYYYPCCYIQDNTSLSSTWRYFPPNKPECCGLPAATNKSSLGVVLHAGSSYPATVNWYYRVFTGSASYTTSALIGYTQYVSLQPSITGTVTTPVQMVLRANTSYLSQLTMCYQRMTMLNGTATPRATLTLNTTALTFTPSAPALYDGTGTNLSSLSFTLGNSSVIADLFENAGDFYRYVSANILFKNFNWNQTGQIGALGSMYPNSSFIWSSVSTPSYAPVNLPGQTWVASLSHFIHSFKTGNVNYYVPIPEDTTMRTSLLSLKNSFPGIFHWASFTGSGSDVATATTEYSNVMIYTWTGVERLQQFFVGSGNSVPFKFSTYSSLYF